LAGAGAHDGFGPCLVWLRQDLRLADNPALAAACASGRPVLAVYVLDDETPGPWVMGGASRWWLHGSLAALQRAYADRGGALILRRGRADDVLLALVRECAVAEVHWSRCYEPFAVARDARLKAALVEAGVTVESHNASLLHEPWTLRTGAGGPFKVFSPFWRAALAAGPVATPKPAPGRIPAPDSLPPSADLNDWRLLPTRPDWAGGLRSAWTPGEDGAQARLGAFLSEALSSYAAGRDRPDRLGTSRLSAHLHFGEIGPRQVWAAIETFVHAHPEAQSGADKFLSELGWREFAAHLLFHFTDLPSQNWRSAFDDFPWAPDETAITAWQRGETGYPIVDAGMRELWTTGWMHNRVRMIVASFLIKDLLVHWRRGEEWFWDTLVDADLANNAAGWQWVAGSGADAAPYFRVFNPVTQGAKFDPGGAYVRRWLPELAGLPDKHVHAPWEAPPGVLDDAGVRLGRTYPAPIVNHAQARVRALAAYKQLAGAA